MGSKLRLSFLIIAVGFISFPSFAQIQCADLYVKPWANDILTRSLPVQVKRPILEDMSHQQVLEMVGRPFELFEYSGGKGLILKPLLLHRLSDFSPTFRSLLQSLYASSVRPRWLERATENNLNMEFEAAAHRMGVTGKEVREVYELDVETFSQMRRIESEFVREVGIEVAQFVVEFKDGTILKSSRFTDYFVDTINEYAHILEPFLLNLPNKPIQSFHILHTHPSLSPGSAALLSAGDLATLVQVRLDFLHLMPRQDVETIDFHIYAVARSERQLLVGHFSEKGWGSE